MMVAPSTSSYDPQFANGRSKNSTKWRKKSSEKRQKQIIVILNMEGGRKYGIATSSYAIIRR